MPRLTCTGIVFTLLLIVLSSASHVSAVNEASGSRPRFLQLQPECPDGTGAHDIIVCETDPPTPNNSDTILTASDGNDHVTVENGVTQVTEIVGDRNWGPSAQNETFIINGEVGLVFGDVRNGLGSGDDIFVNNNFDRRVLWRFV